MKEFEVTITETLQKSITVEAATREEAQAMVEEMWDKGDVVLDAESLWDAWPHLEAAAGRAAPTL